MSHIGSFGGIPQIVLDHGVELVANFFGGIGLGCQIKSYTKPLPLTVGQSFCVTTYPDHLSTHVVPRCIPHSNDPPGAKSHPTKPKPSKCEVMLTLWPVRTLSVLPCATC